MSSDIPVFYKNPDFYQDDKSYVDMIKEQEDHLIEESLNPLSGKRNWTAMCLSQYNQADKNQSQSLQGQRIPIKLRVMGTLDSCIPDPCKEQFSDEEQKRIKSCHPTGYSARPLGVGETVPQFGHMLNMSFTSGPSLNGKHRGLQYTNPSGKNQLRYNCESGTFSVVNAGFTTLYEEVQPDTGPASGEISNGKIIKGGINLNWEELKEIGREKLFEELLSNIAKHESGDAAYDAYNRGACGTCGSRGDAGMIAAYGKKLSELTIATVTKKAMTEEKIDGKSLFASGKYQIVPGTLNSAIDKIKGCNTAEVYGPEQQEAFGVYLMLMKRQKLGKYLLGDTSISAADAQLAMAQEWAGIRVIANHHRKESKGGCRKAANLVPGNSYYKDYDNWCKGKDGKKISPTNPPPRKDSNPDNIKLDRAKATAAAIEAARQKCDKSAYAQDLAKKQGVKK